MEKTYVSYLRVSTSEQGQSGLGLNAQREAVERFVRCSDCIVAEYVEVESGKKDSRPQLAAAIAKAKATGSTLVISKLDRLSRNAAFIFTLRDSGVNFVAADCPDANTLTIGLMATFAQHEREQISQRTKAALAAKKAQGHKLGKPENMTAAITAKGLEVRKANARNAQENKQAAYVIAAERAKDKPTGWQAIVDMLNAMGFKTVRGKEWGLSGVYALHQRTIMDEQYNNAMKA